jgi:hypothetical protein
MEDKFFRKNLTQEIKDNWNEYLKIKECVEFWDFIGDFAKEMFLSGYLFGSSHRIHTPFLEPVMDKPITLYFFRNNPGGEDLIISDSGHTIRTIKMLKLKNKLTESEQVQIQTILDLTGCRFQNWGQYKNSIPSIEIVSELDDAIKNCLKLGQSILMIYGLFSKWFKKYEAAANLGIYSEEYQKYIKRWDDLAYEQ